MPATPTVRGAHRCGGRNLHQAGTGCRPHPQQPDSATRARSPPTAADSRRELAPTGPDRTGAGPSSGFACGVPERGHGAGPAVSGCRHVLADESAQDRSTPNPAMNRPAPGDAGPRWSQPASSAASYAHWASTSRPAPARRHWPAWPDGTSAAAPAAPSRLPKHTQPAAPQPSPTAKPPLPGTGQPDTSRALSNMPAEPRCPATPTTAPNAGSPCPRARPLSCSGLPSPKSASAP
jgi:hypothetical protein